MVTLPEGPKDISGSRQQFILQAQLITQKEVPVSDLIQPRQIRKISTAWRGLCDTRQKHPGTNKCLWVFFNNQFAGIQNIVRILDLNEQISTSGHQMRL